MKKLLFFFIIIVLVPASIYAPFDQLLKELQFIQTGSEPKTFQQQKLAIMVKTMVCIKHCTGLLEDVHNNCMHNCLNA